MASATQNPFTHPEAHFFDTPDKRWNSAFGHLHMILGSYSADTPTAFAKLAPLPRNQHDMLTRWILSLEHLVRLLLITLAAQIKVAPLWPYPTRARKPSERKASDPNDPAAWRPVLRILSSLSRGRGGRRSNPSAAARERRNARLRARNHDNSVAGRPPHKTQREIEAERARNEAFYRDLENDFADYRQPECTFEDILNAPMTAEDEAFYQELLILEGGDRAAIDALAAAHGIAPPRKGRDAETAQPTPAYIAAPHGDDTDWSVFKPDPPPAPVPTFHLARKLEALARVFADPMARAQKLAIAIERRRLKGAVLRLPEIPSDRRQDFFFRTLEIRYARATAEAALLARDAEPSTDDTS
jgi:hypothetical protein